MEKEQQIKPNPSRRRQIIKIRAEINEVETKRTVEQTNETKPLARLIKKKRERTQINKKSLIKDERSQPTPKK